MDIRRLDERDFPQVLAIEKATQTAPWSKEAFQRCWEANYPGWVMHEGDTIIAFIFISLAVGECHILNLCVHPDYQRKQYGYQMLTYVLEWSKQQGTGIVYLEVRRSNTPAIALYNKMDFKLIGERKAYYPDPKGKSGEDALIFARDLGIER
jgi:ribosomal-protein-alanine N-acetyltransferase